jgi:hypothetical protein
MRDSIHRKAFHSQMPARAVSSIALTCAQTTLPSWVESSVDESHAGLPSGAAVHSHSESCGLGPLVPKPRPENPDAARTDPRGGSCSPPRAGRTEASGRSRP